MNDLITQTRTHKEHPPYHYTPTLTPIRPHPHNNLAHTHRWAPAGPPIEAATLTVTRIVFSPCGGWLLCSSRDRSIVLLKRREHGALSALGAVRAEGVEGDGQHGESTPGEEQAPFTVVHRVLKVYTCIVCVCADGCLV